MTATLNASTSSGVVLTSDTSGSLAIQSNGTTIMTVASTGVSTQVGSPAFSVYNTGGQTISTGTFTKVAFNTKTFDTNNNFDATTNYRFTPTVAGYYQINLAVRDATGAVTGALSACIYKNGSLYSQVIGVNTANGCSATSCTIVYCNGSTDYIEGYALQTSGANMNLPQGGTQVYMSGSMVRSA